MFCVVSREATTLLAIPWRKRRIAVSKIFGISRVRARFSSYCGTVVNGAPPWPETKSG